MKKVAILTQPLHTNYGGTLQAYALQKVILSLGAGVVTIDYKWKQRNIFIYILAVIKSHILNRKEKYPFLSKENDIREKNHINFIENNIVRSEPIFNEMELSKHLKKNEYDTIVVGSDQVWRVEYSPNIDNFFLNFIKWPVKKVSYAASFGVDTWQFSSDKTLKIAEWLKKFNYLSVREDSAVGLCKEHLNINVEHVLDPTLLIKKENYMQLVSDVPEQGGGIFSYILDKSEEKNKILNLISEKMQLDTFTKQPLKTQKDTLFINNENEYIYPKIEEWIASFRDASFIITDSFHGTVFSIIFNKPFLCISNLERGSARFNSLLNKFDLNKRLVESIDQLGLEIIKENINYENINEILERERVKSLDFLKKSIFD